MPQFSKHGMSLACDNMEFSSRASSTRSLLGAWSLNCNGNDKANYDNLKKEWTLENVKDEQLTLEEIDAKQSLCIRQCQDTFVRYSHYQVSK